MKAHMAEKYTPLGILQTIFRFARLVRKFLNIEWQKNIEIMNHQLKYMFLLSFKTPLSPKKETLICI